MVNLIKQGDFNEFLKEFSCNDIEDFFNTKEDSDPKFEPENNNLIPQVNNSLNLKENIKRIYNEDNGSSNKNKYTIPLIIGIWLLVEGLKSICIKHISITSIAKITSPIMQVFSLWESGIIPLTIGIFLIIIFGSKTLTIIERTR